MGLECGRAGGSGCGAHRRPPTLEAAPVGPTQLEARGGAEPKLIHEDAPRGKELTLSRLQSWSEASLTQPARKAGMRPRVEFPRLDLTFPPGQPLFVPVGP